MGTQFLLIDGYNLLHAAGLAHDRYGPGQFEKCRNQLLQEIADRLSEAQRERTTVIFDAQDAPPDVPAVQQFARISVVFSVGSDADTMIEAMLESHAAPRQILVVSSDHRLQKAASRRKAKSIDSEKFWELAVGEEDPVQKTAEELLKLGEAPVEAKEVAEIVMRLKAESAAGEVSGDESVTGRYERELTDRAEEALREWGEGQEEGS
jgi:predicted RNA-binding protein with PIN domain